MGKLIENVVRNLGHLRPWVLVGLMVWAFSGIGIAQTCVGGQIYSQDAFLYGRFEVGMRSAAGNGIVSSFFLYNLDVGCNWPAENNEIDIEMTGNKQNLLFTTHYPGPWYYTDSVVPAFNPHDSLHDYAIEWEPGIVRWFVDGQLRTIQNQSFVAGLIHPMRVVMNLWAADNISWVGPWDPGIMPMESEYEYVRSYTYTPGSGQAGTSNNFTLAWQDDFTQLDTSIWVVEEHGGFGGNFCTFKPSSIDFRNGRMYLQLEEEPANLPDVPVAFSVDLRTQQLQPFDVIFLNGSFNNWCGSCAPMNESNGIWSITLDLPPDKYEYLFTKNIWEANGGAPLGSSCDFKPCDQWGNYGFIVNANSAPVQLDTVCWGECSSCLATEVVESRSPSARPARLVRVTDLLGREAQPSAWRVLLYHYDDGRIVKRVVVE